MIELRKWPDQARAQTYPRLSASAGAALERLARACLRRIAIDKAMVSGAMSGEFDARELRAEF